MPLRVLIVGGGIGGLATALCLQARGIRSQVFERASVLRPLGVGINLPQYSIHRGTLHMLLYRTVLERLGADSVQLGASFVAATHPSTCAPAR